MNELHKIDLDIRTILGSAWSKQRDQFTEEEKVLLRLAVVSQSICPSGVTLDMSKIPEVLVAKLKSKFWIGK